MKLKLTFLDNWTELKFPLLIQLCYMFFELLVSHLIYAYTFWRSSYQVGRDVKTFTGINNPHCSIYPKVCTGFLTSYVVGVFVHLVKMRGDCLFC